MIPLAACASRGIIVQDAHNDLVSLYISVDWYIEEYTDGVWIEFKEWRKIIADRDNMRSKLRMWEAIHQDKTEELE